VASNNTPQTGEASAEETRIHTLEALNEKVDRIADQIREFFSAGGHAAGKPGEAEGITTRPAAGPPATQTAAATAEDRRREIRDELGKLKAQETADAAAQAVQDRIGTLERAAEKPPRELRRIEQLMRWGE
jgi:hypothetical protein